MEAVVFYHGSEQEECDLWATVMKQSCHYEVHALYVAYVWHVLSKALEDLLKVQVTRLTLSEIRVAGKGAAKIASDLFTAIFINFESLAVLLLVLFSKF